jgi:hypothetical protein
MKFEQLRQNPFRTAGLALAVGLASITLASCGDDSGSAPKPEDTTAEDAPNIRADLYPNGTRVLRYINDSGYYADVLQACDGTDLIEQTEFLKYGYGAGGNSVERSVNHPACADGKLTASDFKIAG